MPGIRVSPAQGEYPVEVVEDQGVKGRVPPPAAGGMVVRPIEGEREATLPLAQPHGSPSPPHTGSEAISPCPQTQPCMCHLVKLGLALGPTLFLLCQLFPG